MYGVLVSLRFLLILTQAWESSGPYGGMVQAAAVDPLGNPYLYATVEGFFRKIAESEWERLDDYSSSPPFQVSWMNDLAVAYGNLWAAPANMGLWWRSTSSSGWHQVADIPAGANVIGIALLGDSASRMVVATSQNGLWVSDDEGANFNIVEGWENPGVINAIAANQQFLAVALNGDEIHIYRNIVGSWKVVPEDIPSYVEGSVTSLAWSGEGVGPFYLHVGTTAGITYVKNPQLDMLGEWQGEMRLPGAVVVDIFATTTLYAATLGGIQLSTDYGDSWVPSNSGLNSFWVTDLAGLNGGSAIFAATFDGIYREAGEAWGIVEGLPALHCTDMDLNRQNPSGLFASALGSGAFKSTNAGGQWSRVAPNEIPMTLNLASGEAEPTIIYAAQIDGIAASRDSGKTWEEKWSTGDEQGNPSRVICVTCNPDYAEEVWFVTQGVNAAGNNNYYGVWFSGDVLGSTTLLGDLGSTRVSDIVFSPEDQRLYVCAESGVFRSDTPRQGGSLDSLGKEGVPTDANINQLELAGDRLYSCSNKGKIYASDDNAGTWESVPGLESTYIQGIAADSDFLVAVDAYNQSLKGFSAFVTSSAGEEWEKLTDIVPGMAKAGAVEVVDSTAHIYVASAEGIFYDTYEIESEQPVEETLHFTVTPMPVQFRPETGKGTEFQLGGDVDVVESWSLEIYSPGGDFVTAKSGQGLPPASIPWDGYTGDGLMYGAGTYTAVFHGENANASGDAEAAVDLVIGEPPLSTYTNATRGNRLLVQSRVGAYDYGSLVYRSREPQEFFGVSYDAQSKEFFDGYPLSGTRDINTQLASVTLADDGTHWLVWMDNDPEEPNFPFLLLSGKWDGDQFDKYTVIATNSAVVDAAVAVSETGHPLTAYLINSDGSWYGLYRYFDGLAWDSGDNSFQYGDPIPLSELELVSVTGGVHILYLANNTLHDFIWTEPEAPLVDSTDPRIPGVAEITATARKDSLYVFYIESSGTPFLIEYGKDGWSEPQNLSSVVSGNPRNMTCSINDDNDLTLAWSDGGTIYYTQRIDGVWGTAATQPTGPNASNPQLPARLYSTSQPLIAWTEGASLPASVPVVQLGEAPPSEDTTFDLTIYASEKLPQGDTLPVKVVSGEPAYYINIWIEMDETGDEIWPDSVTEWLNVDSVLLDSLEVFFYYTDDWPLGNYWIRAEGESEGLTGNKWGEASQALEVVPGLDSTVLIDRENVFFVPSPAVQETYGRVYYDLNYDAEITLEIFTARGRRILEHFEGGEGNLVEAGYHNYIEVNIEGLGSDVYFFRLTAYVPSEDENSATQDFWAIPEDVRPNSMEVVTKPFVVVR